MQELLEGYGGRDRTEKQTTDYQRTALHRHINIAARLRIPVGHSKTHQRRRHHKIHDGRHEQGKKLEERGMATLPDHQGSDVAKRAEGTASISRDNNINATEGDKLRIVGANR